MTLAVRISMNLSELWVWLGVAALIGAVVGGVLAWWVKR